MKNTKFKLILVPFLLFSMINLAIAAAKDDPFISKAMFDQLELRDTAQGNPFVLSGQFWLGHDLNKLWIKTEFESLKGEAEEAEIQALYSKAVATYWDFQVGLRSDLAIDSLNNKNWAVIGFQGLAPYFFEIDSALFIGESGRTAFRFEAEYEILFSQRLILTPEIEINFYGKNDEISRTGSGLSDSEIGLRLRYEIRRGFAPYIGYVKTNTFGETANYAQLDGKLTNDSSFVLGIRAWF